MAEKEDRQDELRFKQIAATAVVVPEPVGARVHKTRYGLGEDGRVYMLTEQGWSGVKMHRAEKHG